MPISKEPLPALPLPALPVKLPVSLIYVRPLQWLAPRVTMGASSISQIVTNRESPDRLQFSTEHEVRDEVSLSVARALQSSASWLLALSARSPTLSPGRRSKQAMLASSGVPWSNSSVEPLEAGARWNLICWCMRDDAPWKREMYASLETYLREKSERAVLEVSAAGGS